MTVRIVREMGRESVGYLRGQLLVSLAVGGFTGLGLLLCGVPSWLLLGFLMGLLELIPYVGPFLGGVLVALFAWPGGWSRMLWSLGVVVLVQQLEGGMLSPQLMSETTRLHPIVVLLCVMAGRRGRRDCRRSAGHSRSAVPESRPAGHPAQAAGGTV